MISPDGDVLSGVWRVNEHLETVPNPVGDWVLWKDGVATRLGTPSLTEALDLPVLPQPICIPVCCAQHVQTYECTRYEPTNSNRNVVYSQYNAGRRF